ncbi:syringomycin biosynthesis enzyme-like protein [Cryphonectria parasitica EP155]|uniref:Syringomycin biosynthesis enzyme-like protein n=1 Tax=Cryphonectria parasitica (strain ATCC 38755 / EP155) TaxID=660469 RepID=A0A9P4Y124_CRYP1|nr:syringomycin biosynthesis enzyme-like protein [Cryphonectria parasitica EP155]KAF3765024.1 syringomycin biosynthesis enzyme-like protein [Cryphonectria parasitica EP155]
MSPIPELTPAAIDSIPEQKHFTVDGFKIAFPLVLTPGPAKFETQTTAFTHTDAVIDWITRRQGHLVQLAQTHGAILLRGFCPPISTPVDFDAVCKSFGLTNFPYVGGAAPRTVITGSVFTANESPADQLIPFHHEMAQSKTHPGTLFFYCMKPALEGGETPIVLSNLVYERIRAEFPTFVQELEEKGVRYVRVLPKEDDPSSAIGRGWKSTFAVKTKRDAESVGRDMGMEVEWLEGDLLRTTTAVVPATKKDPRTGRISWFNSIVAAFTGWKDKRNDPQKAVVFGDGGAMNANILSRCLEIMNELAVSFVWERGDVLLVDNWVTLHSRNSFQGERVIYASLWK